MALAKRVPQIELRDARISDAADIAGLAEALGYPSTAQQVRERMQSMLRDPRNHITVAEMTGDGLVGWVHVYRHELLEMDPFAEIGGLIVGEAYRGRGIASHRGGTLLDACLRDYRSTGTHACRARAGAQILLPAWIRTAQDPAGTLQTHRIIGYSVKRPD